MENGFMDTTLKRKKEINEDVNDSDWLSSIYYNYDDLMNDCNAKTRSATSNPILNRLSSSRSTTYQEPTNEASSRSTSLGLRSRTKITPDGKAAKKLKHTPDSTVDNPPSLKHSSHPIWKKNTSINQFISNRIQLHENRSVIDAIDFQIKLLRSGFQDTDGWRQIIDDGDIDNCMTNYDIFKVRRKCEYLTHALLIARMKYHIVSFPWSDCTKAAIKNVNDYHATTEDEKGEVKRHCRITNHETLRKYYITFRKSLYFPNPYKCHKRRGVIAHVFQ